MDWTSVDPNDRASMGAAVPEPASLPIVVADDETSILDLLDKVLGGAAKDAMEKGKGMLEENKGSVGGTLNKLLGK